MAFKEITENLDTHIATSAHTRAIKYTYNDTAGQKFEIVIDLLHQKDIGAPQATSQFLTHMIQKGIDTSDITWTVRKYLIG